MSANDLLLLLERPKEPVFIAKGDRKAVFEVPDKFVQERFRPARQEILSRFGKEAEQRISVKDIAIPDLSVPMELNRFENFSLFIPRHRRVAGRLIEIFMGVRNIEDLTSVAVYARDLLNPYLFNYSLSVALLHRPDTRNVDVPSFIASFPDKYVDGTILQKVKEEAEIIPEGSRMPIVIPRDYTASDLEPEHRLAYFREDLGVNLHHWHWHLVYPFDGPDSVVRKDRRGELFFYMHQQLMARYNFERLCNKLARTERLLDWSKPIPEAYFPKLDSLVSSRGWPARVENSKLSDVRREKDQISTDISDLERWRDRIYAAIHSGTVMLANGSTQQLDEFGGIDVLGNIIEASSLSPNTNFYGNLHNLGHVFLSVIHDPDGRFLESFSTIGDSATAMRDPIFYRWHAFIDDIFQELKATLPGYTGPQLNYQGINVTGVEIDVTGGKKNELQTFWQQSDVDLSRGMDFTPRGSVFARFTHLQHAPFSYKISVNNQTNGQRQGTCRIFLAPKFDERGTNWLLRDQRHMFIELDRFVVNLKVGQNVITRRSDESTVTIPFERTFRDLDTGRPTNNDAQFNFCGCGWPQHMLIPRGAPDGFQCELFVMISNYEDDKIAQTLTGQCNDAFSFCGLKDRLYPDRRSMGFPFDRMPPQGVDTLQQYLLPNMRVQDVTIKFTAKTVQGPKPRQK
ncbi:Prophenoloxidase 2 [Carabus blaptoides fortunei]